MSVFDNLLAVADATVDRMYSEGFGFQPMVEVRNRPPTTDGSRAAIAEFAAIFDERGTLLPMASEAGSKTTARIDFDPMLSVQDYLLPQGVRRFDRVTRLKNSVAYEVKAVMPDGLGRSVLVLTKLTS